MRSPFLFINTRDMPLDTIYSYDPLFPDAINKINGNFGKVENIRGPIANRPSPGVEGRIYIPDTGSYIHRDNGTVWESFGPIFRCNVPNVSDWTWNNQGSTTVTTNPSGSVTLYHPGASGTGYNWSHLQKPLPSGNFTWTTLIRSHMISAAAFGGISLRNDSTGAFITVGIGVNASSTTMLYVDKMTNNTTFSASYVTFSVGTMAYPLRWFRIRDDGTNRITSISYDGEVWIQIHSVSRTDFTTPTHYAFSLRGTGNNIPHAITILSERMELG